MSSLEEAPLVELKDPFEDDDLLLQPINTDDQALRNACQQLGGSYLQPKVNPTMTGKTSYETDNTGKPIMIYTPIHPSEAPMTQQLKRRIQPPRAKRSSQITDSSEYHSPARRTPQPTNRVNTTNARTIIDMNPYGGSNNQSTLNPPNSQPYFINNPTYNNNNISTPQANVPTNTLNASTAHNQPPSTSGYQPVMSQIPRFQTVTWGSQMINQLNQQFSFSHNLRPTLTHPGSQSSTSGKTSAPNNLPPPTLFSDIISTQQIPSGNIPGLIPKAHSSGTNINTNQKFLDIAEKVQQLMPQCNPALLHEILSKNQNLIPTTLQNDPMSWHRMATVIMDNKELFSNATKAHSMQPQQHQHNLTPKNFSIPHAPQLHQQNNPPSYVAPPAPPRPSEDDMAKQDIDADVGQDDEYQEVETYADYVPSKLSIGHPHPDPVVETSSLSAVEPPEITYDLKLPDKVIDRASLSALQLESVIYACQQHNQLLPDNKTRRGFLIGDGAGVGKGRTIAGIIYENYLCGRKKSIWLSVSTDLKLDAERDLKDIGAKIPVFLLGKFAYGKRINEEHGVMFLTYSGLVSKSSSVRGNLGTRLGQLVSWAGTNFDGVIVFDECHKAKNIAISGSKKTSSKAAECAVELQNMLPKARVVYASATGASETKHLGYMTRLGIWGQGTPYREFFEFCDAIERRGVGAMELVAVDLKTRGSYMARQLSFKTTSFDIKVAELSQDFINVYDESVDLWATALDYFRKAVCYVSSKSNRVIWTSFWAAHQRFFKYLCIGAKVPVVVDIARKALTQDKCVVIGLQTTGEARTIEAVEDGDVNDFISTAKATFESLIDSKFPMAKKYQNNDIRIRQNSAMRFIANNNHLLRESPESSGSTIEDIRSDKDIMNEAGPANIKQDLSDDNNRRLTRRTSNKQETKTPSKSKQSESEPKSSRALRARRRAIERGDEDKKRGRVRMIHDTDSELSNASGTESSDDTTDTRRSDDDDTDFINDESDSSSGTITDNNDEDDTDCENIKRKIKVSSSPRKKLQPTLNEDSDSDVQITEVRPRKKVYEVIILSSDEDDDNYNNNIVNSRSAKELRDPVEEHADELKKMRDDLMERIEKLGPKLPTNTLDDLIDQLGGPTKVAEMTGRKGRLVKDKDGQVTYRQRNEIDALEDLNILEKGRFMEGKKLIAIISEAASSGISLQADKRVRNQRRRVHITIELPWSADRAIQQFGRTHRSNQVSGPEYVFIISELSGERRFASIVARRLESLGALTHGDRRATTDSRDLTQFNIASRFSRQALEQLLQTIESGPRVSSIQPNYEPIARFSKDAKDAFIGAGLAESARYGFEPDKNVLNVNHFLNRLLGMKVNIQNALFKLFTDYMDRLIVNKKVLGQYDAGILELNSESGKTKITDVEHFLLNTHCDIIKCSIRNVQVERGIPWNEALDLLNNPDRPKDSREGFYISRNRLTGAEMVFLLIREAQFVDKFRTYKPNVGKAFKPDYFSFLTENVSKSEPEIVEPMWNRVYKITDTKCVHICFFGHCKRLEANVKCDVGLRHRKYCILSGGILTAWPYLEKNVPEATKKLQIVRLKLDKGNKVIGPIIPQEYVETVRRVLKMGEKGIQF